MAWNCRAMPLCRAAILRGQTTKPRRGSTRRAGTPGQNGWPAKERQPAAGRGHVTRQQQRGYQGYDELASGPGFEPTQKDSAFQQCNGGSAPFTASHTETHSELGPAFQPGDGFGTCP
ncbi:MAG: hypothetical protein GY696_37805 [Gammaproteobacteria bacterium]|nr:hypothetical protein [Gammaproteobacteria bacterium]